MAAYAPHCGGAKGGRRRRARTLARGLGRTSAFATLAFFSLLLFRESRRRVFFSSQSEMFTIKFPFMAFAPGRGPFAKILKNIGAKSVSGGIERMLTRIPPQNSPMFMRLYTDARIQEGKGRRKRNYELCGMNYEVSGLATLTANEREQGGSGFPRRLVLPTKMLWFAESGGLVRARGGITAQHSSYPSSRATAPYRVGDSRMFPANVSEHAAKVRQ
jgi:hypothetical protein